MSKFTKKKKKKFQTTLYLLVYYKFNTCLVLDTTSTLIRSSSPLALSNITAKSSDDQKRKKSSPRSLQRAKLERTFKEKGFLIQTQQLQSAEGATYCKFRQLRKFTRYLFRSWKDYLPNDEQREKASTSKI